MATSTARQRRIAWGCALTAIGVTAVGIPLVSAIREARLTAQAMSSQ